MRDAEAYSSHIKEGRLGTTASDSGLDIFVNLPCPDHEVVLHVASHFVQPAL